MSDLLTKLKELELEQVRMFPVASVHPYPGNAKSHSSMQVRRIAHSIADYGWDQPIVVDSDNIIIKGHGRFFAARDFLNLEEVPVIVARHLDSSEIRLIRILDNKSAESDWDTTALWDELQLLEAEGITFKDVGFDQKAYEGIFSGKVPPGGDDEPGQSGSEGHYDPTTPLEEGFISPHSGEDAWLRNLSMADYLEYHDKIVVGFSSGKDSLCALVWILENCDNSKIVPFFVNPGWGVDWPHSIAFVDYFQTHYMKDYGIDIHIFGDPDPTAQGAFEDLLLEKGYVGMASCFVQSILKMKRVYKFFDQHNLWSKNGQKVVQIIAARWEESPDRAKTYPDRGVLKDTGNDYASPVVAWSGTDVAKFLDERGIRLHTAYECEDRMGCLVCPKVSPEGSIAIRKKLPKLWADVVKWYARGARRYEGRIQVDHFWKWLVSSESSRCRRSRLVGAFSNMAFSSSEMEETLRPGQEKGWLAEKYFSPLHKVRDELLVE